MSARTIRNAIALLAVLAVVSGAVWWREARRTAPVDPHGLPRLVDVGANACEACQKLAPILAELREEYAGRLSVEVVDLLETTGAREQYDVSVMPTQVLYDAAGVEVWRHEGFIAKADLRAIIAAELGVE
ncbi:MAG: thioredoxin family protein [Planctomycetota bacterium]